MHVQASDNWTFVFFIFFNSLINNIDETFLVVNIEFCWAAGCWVVAIATFMLFKCFFKLSHNIIIFHHSDFFCCLHGILSVVCYRCDACNPRAHLSRSRWSRVWLRLIHSACMSTLVAYALVQTQVYLHIMRSTCISRKHLNTRASVHKPYIQTHTDTWPKATNYLRLLLFSSICSCVLTLHRLSVCSTWASSFLWYIYPCLVTFLKNNMFPHAEND